MDEVITTFLEDGYGTFLMSLETGEVEGSVPTLVTVSHIQLLYRNTRQQEICVHVKEVDERERERECECTSQQLLERQVRKDICCDISRKYLGLQK